MNTSKRLAYRTISTIKYENKIQEHGIFNEIRICHMNNIERPKNGLANTETPIYKTIQDNYKRQNSERPIYSAGVPHVFNNIYRYDVTNINRNSGRRKRHSCVCRNSRIASLQSTAGVGINIPQS